MDVLALTEPEFLGLYAQVVEKAKALLATDNQTCGDNWPAGQSWDHLAGTSKSIFMTRARKVLLVDEERFLKTVRNWPYTDTAWQTLGELFGK
jgi:hypothetical protein